LIRIVIGPPIETAGRDPRELNAEVQNWIEGTMRVISAPAQGWAQHQTSRFDT